MKILVASHGSLAKEFVETSKMIAGDIENVYYLGLETGDSLDGFRDEIVELLVNDHEIKIILVDLIGGSPMIASALAIEASNRTDIDLIGGMNLSLLLELSQVHIHNDEWDIEEVVDMARQSIRIIRKGE